MLCARCLRSMRSVTRKVVIATDGWGKGSLWSKGLAPGCDAPASVQRRNQGAE